MAVRKKSPQDPQTPENGDRIDLTRHLKRVREAIGKLPTDDQEHDMTNETTTATEAGEKSTKAATKKSPKKKPAKKVEKKAAAAKFDHITLAEICKGLKMEPRRARRILRGADLKAIEVDGQRWTWKKGSNAHDKVVEVLKAADSDK